MSNEKQPSFRVGEDVVYPGHGVLKITAIEPYPASGTEDPYYHYTFRSMENRRGVMAVSDETFLRKTSSNSEIREVINYLRVGNEQTIWKYEERARIFDSLIRLGGLADLARVLKMSEEISKRQSLNSRDKDLCKKAKRLLVEEIMVVWKCKEEEVLLLINDSLKFLQNAG